MKIKNRLHVLKGFTLVELLVVMAIIGILAIVSFANFQTSQIKARDAERKANLHQIANSMEAYMNDHASYPNASGGKIKACADGGGICKATANATPCEWTGVSSREFCDENNTVYMKEVPSDPTGAPVFCYESTGSSFKIYARLENQNDPDIKTIAGTHCGLGTYNFGISSGNTTP
ncbi:MAG: type II secretion system protein [bacterium]|nr:type II secretion system protein [bacterium]